MFHNVLFFGASAWVESPGPSSSLGDAWLLQQLRQTEAEAEAEEQLRRGNDFLDRYLVRLLKLKRHLDQMNRFFFGKSQNQEMIVILS